MSPAVHALEHGEGETDCDACLWSKHRFDATPLSLGLVEPICAVLYGVAPGTLPAVDSRMHALHYVRGPPDSI